MTKEIVLENFENQEIRLMKSIRRPTENSARRKTARSFFIAMTSFIAIAFAFPYPACSQARQTDSKLKTEQQTEQNGKILVAYFSRVDENYSVGYITEGNTAKIAKIIARKTNADLFEIKTVRTYDKNYEKATQEAREEQSKKSRPELSADLSQTEIEKYDTIFIGYPIWWGDLPMAMYTFLENKNLDGKTIVPFCTHEGSGLSGTVNTFRSMFKNSSVKNGLAIRGRTAQNDSSASEKAIDDWLENIGF